MRPTPAPDDAPSRSTFTPDNAPEPPIAPDTPDTPDAPDDPGLTVPDIIQQLADGSLRPSDLHPEDRHACISYLITEGFSTPQMARFMRVSERTIRRDRAALRKADAQPPDPTLADQLLGEMRRHADACIHRLINLAKDPKINPHTRVWSNASIVRILQRQLEATHRVKYLEDGRARLLEQTRTPEEKRYHAELDAIIYGPPIPRFP